MFDIFTDGGCSGNPGPGGWAFICGEEKRSGAERETTNNRMELTAVIKALEWAASARTGKPLSVFTDSQYVKRGITEWIHTWEKNGWKTKDKKPVKNQDLWQKLQKLSKDVHPSWQWVKGHAGNPLNEECDALVQAEIRKIKNGRT